MTDDGKMEKKNILILPDISFGTEIKCNSIIIIALF